MILSYKLCINILPEPVRTEIKRTQTKNKKTVLKYLNDEINVLYETIVLYKSFL